MANGPSKQTTNRDSWWIVGLALLAFLGYNNFCTGDEPPVTSRPRPTMASTTYPPPTEPTRPTTTTRLTTTTISQREYDDLRFWSLVDRRQVDGSFDWRLPDDLIRLGRAVCQDLRAGMSPTGLVDTLARDFSYPDSQIFVVTAAEVLCPEFY